MSSLASRRRAGRRGGAETSDHARRVEPVRLDAAPEWPAASDRCAVTACDGREERFACGAGCLGDGERRGDDGDAAVKARARVPVIELRVMRDRAVHECRVRRVPCRVCKPERSVTVGAGYEVRVRVSAPALRGRSEGVEKKLGDARAGGSAEISPRQ